MNKIKQGLAILALTFCAKPIHSIDKSTAAAAAACAVVAGGAVYCAYQWYTEGHYWTVRGITNEVEYVLRTNLGQFNPKLHWDCSLQFHGLHHRTFTRNQAEVTLDIIHQNGQWLVRCVHIAVGLTQQDIKNPGLLTINVTYTGTQDRQVEQIYRSQKSS